MPTTIDNKFLIKKETVFVGILFFGMLIAYYSSLYPWPLWPLKGKVSILAAIILLAAFWIKPDSSKNVFTRTDFIAATLLYFTLELYQRLVGDSNIIGFASVVFHVFIFMTLFQLDKDILPKLMMFLTKFMAVIQVIALIGFFLFLLGFPLPSRDATFDNEFYFYTNYYFFLLDDRQMLVLFPRFQSYFVEPNYHGTACVLLLFYQCGRWKKWYNIVLLITSLLSFSLSAYVLLVVVLFLNSWRRGKHIFRQVLLSIIIIGSVVGASFVYNDGENLVHDLILLRLEVEDGELAGNDRITDNFKHDYEKFWKSDDILFGRERDKSEFGNQGYQVYIYENGLIGLFLLIIFYISATYKAPNKRSLISAWVMVILIFGVNGEITWNQIFIPIFCTAFSEPDSAERAEMDSKRKKKETSSCNYMNENNNMRIAYVLHSTDPLAGATKAFLFLLKGLMAKGIIPFVIVPDKRGIYSTLEDMGVVVLVLNYRPEAWTYRQTAKDFLLFLPRMVARLYVNWLSSIRLTAWLKDKNISLVHTNVGVISIGFRAARRLNIPHIYHIREYGDKDFNIRYFPNKHAFWYQFKAPKSYSICITRDIQAYHKQDGNQHSQVIYDGVMPAVAVCPHIDKENYLLYAGRIEQAKGLDILLEAYSDYVEKSSTIIPLWIAGSMNNSQYLDKIKSIVSNRKLSQHITFLGERNDLQSLMQRAKAIIIPSRFEGFGFCMAEAMFNGCLAIGNNTAGTREQFDNGLQLEKKEIGIRYNTKEELTQRLIDITNSPAVHYKDMVARAFHTVNSMYSREKHTENVYVFYKRIIKDSI